MANPAPGEGKAKSILTLRMPQVLARRLRREAPQYFHQCTCDRIFYTGIGAHRVTFKPNMNDHWKLRALCLTRTNQTMMGAVLLAILGHVPPKRPYYKGLAEITKDGVVVAKLYSRGNLLPQKTAVCHVNAFTDELKHIADVCEMDDKERGELFSEARKWIERDHRAKSRLD